MIEPVVTGLCAGFSAAVIWFISIGLGFGLFYTQLQLPVEPSALLALLLSLVATALGAMLMKTTSAIHNRTMWLTWLILLVAIFVRANWTSWVELWIRS